MTGFGLLREKRFGAFFWTQFWGAFNDNFFKNALVILIAFRAASEAEGGLWINIAAGLFILPFILFSPLAGQICDKYEKSKLIRIIKFAEILIMGLAVAGFYLDHRGFLIFVLFLMGTHSTFFGPIKYSILPQTLKDEELVAGNAMVETGTFLAILLGTIAGGIAIGANVHFAAVGVVLFAIIGYFYARKVPIAEAVDKDLKIHGGFFKEIKILSKIAKQESSVNLAIVGISWFWFYGATFLSQIPNFTKYFVGGNEAVGTLFLATFSLSIGIGSLLCEKLSKREIEIGLVPVGSFGMSWAAYDLSAISYTPLPSSALISVLDFLSSGPQAYRILFDLMMVGIFGSLYIVPLYALIQKRGAPNVRSRLIAWLNIVNSFYIIGSAIMAIALYKIGFNTVQIFGVIALLNLAMAIYKLYLIPEFWFRLIHWLISNTLYQTKMTGQEKVPEHGAAFIVSNGMSSLDWFIITATCRRSVRFIVDKKDYESPSKKWFYKMAKSIPFDSSNPQEGLAFIKTDLLDGRIVGWITSDNSHSVPRALSELISEMNIAPLNVHLSGLSGSVFSSDAVNTGPAMPHHIDVQVS